MMENEKRESSLHVSDRRRFNTDGTIKADQEDSHSEPVTPPIPPAPEKKADTGEKKSPQPEFEINFSTFILSLASSVQVALGLVPHPATGKPMTNLVSARQTIDILEMLQNKTRGNLTSEEENLVGQVLYELKMHYVQVLEETKKAPK